MDTSHSDKELDYEIKKRLLKWKHVIKKLVDTAYAYHQDMKIIKDIRK